MSRGGRRADRVAGLVRVHLAELLRDLGDERLSTVVVTDVDVSDDLSVATLSVRALTGDSDAKAQKVLLRALEHASSRLKRGLGSRLELRKLPELRFKYDLGHDAVRRVDALLHEIEAETRAETPGEPPDETPDETPDEK